MCQRLCKAPRPQRRERNYIQIGHAFAHVAETMTLTAPSQKKTTTLLPTPALCFSISSNTISKKLQTSAFLLTVAKQSMQSSRFELVKSKMTGAGEGWAAHVNRQKPKCLRLRGPSGNVTHPLDLPAEQHGTIWICCNKV